jgi:competence protein ComFB
MEELVERTLDEYLAKEPDVCSCAKCRNNMAALALNQLKPVYISTDKGEVYARLRELDWQMRCDITVAVHKAIQTVAGSPRHS